MIAIDTQLLVFAHRAETPWHERARARIAELAEHGVRWAIPMHCLVEFYAKVTHPRIYSPPSTPAQAIAQIDAWLEAPTLTVLSEDVTTWDALRPLLAAGRIAGSPTYDARIAAVCIRHGVSELWTNDRDFLAYPALRTRNPLIDISGAREPRATYRAGGRRADVTGKTPRPRRRGR